MDYEKARRLIDNRIWTRDELKRLRGKIARRRSKSIQNIIHKVHRPWYERESEHKESVDFVTYYPGTILFDLT